MSSSAPARAAGHRGAAASEWWGSGGALPETPGQKYRLIYLSVPAATCPCTLAVETPTPPEIGRTTPPGVCSTWMVMHAAGIRKATEPSTHMIAPAAAWWSSAVIEVRRGAVE